MDENSWEADLLMIGVLEGGKWGYSMATGARALSESLDHKDPLSIKGHYLSRVNPEGFIRVEKLNIGKRFLQLYSSLFKEEKSA
ncbi:MAG: hypothetical protein Ct9H300mP3_00380 [Gammaproteobacteria bacterium]|nr:MAG: hypothetical protein Ct9H300mP3_00380 [Gammaproteobacteria bacterium]